MESGKADPFNAGCVSYCASDLQVDTLKVKEYFASDAQNNYKNSSDEGSELNSQPHNP